MCVPTAQLARIPMPIWFESARLVRADHGRSVGIGADREWKAQEALNSGACQIAMHQIDEKLGERT